MNRVGIAVGVVAILIGLAIGSLMLVSPEGINPAYPIGIALLAPLAFVLGGSVVCAHALDGTTFVATMFKALALCLLVLVNWAAFFTSHIQCRETVSFLGVALLERYPTEVECQTSLRIIMACVDAVVLVLLAAFIWHRVASRGRESTS